MYQTRKKLPTPTEYGFPFEPYEIQQQLMEALFSVVEDSGIGIFESPTGTGKSLTLTCAALCWLQQHEALVRRELLERIADVEAEVKRLEEDGAHAADWIRVQFESTQHRDELRELQSLRALLQAHEQRLKEIRERQTKAARQQRRAAKKRTVEVDQSTENVNDEENDPAQWRELAKEEEEEVMEHDDAESAVPRYRDVQIFFCSRTHSQLAQVVRELKRTVYGRNIRCVSLASRQQLCINRQVRRLPSAALINERCLDMARRSTSAATKTTFCDADGCAQKKARLQRSSNALPSTSKCAFKAPLAVQQLSELALTDVLDIEDLVREGKTERACPYYATRSAVQSAQLIMLPYQMLLHRRTRLQSGINLNGAVIIIDEAHNLLDSISQLYSCELTLPQLLLAQQQIGAYKLRYATRFSNGNLLRINQLLFVARRLMKLLQPTMAPGPARAKTRLLRTYELTGEGDFFNIDLFDLLAFCERSRLAQKLQAFGQRLSTEPLPSENQAPVASKVSAASALLRRLEEKHQKESKSGGGKKSQPSAAAANSDEGGGSDKNGGADGNKTESAAATDAAKAAPNQASPIRPLLAFLEALTENAEDGRILISIGEATAASAFKYILLNPGGHFEDVLREARAIIVAGGTMQPTNELMAQLFHSCPERVQQHFYDHVVPPDSVLPMVVTRGPRGKQLSFNFTQRRSGEMLSELGMILANVCNVVPAGVVCFLPSYEYLNEVYAHLQRTGVLARIAAKKTVFCEPRSAVVAGAGAGAAGGAQSVEQVLTSFATAIGEGREGGGGEVGGALLLSVVGGKLSEGLNFADDLGRAVIVVGLPYPNRRSPELQERMKYLDATLGANAGNEYYENLCMKAVNQCIGRSVRHIRDYACVLLLDERYAGDRIRRKLPHWIGRSVMMPPTYGAMQAATARFFKAKRDPL